MKEGKGERSEKKDEVGEGKRGKENKDKEGKWKKRNENKDEVKER